MSTLFNLLNDSIFGREEPINHKCHEADCKGTRLYGLNLKCHRCNNIDCMASRPESKALLTMMNYSDKNNQKQSGRAESRIKELFHAESVFEFVCPPCKSGAHISDENQTKLLRENSVTIGKQTQLIGELQSRVSSLEFVISDMKNILSTQLTNSNTVLSHYNQCVSDMNKNIKALEGAHILLGDISSSSSQSDTSNATPNVHQAKDAATDSNCNINYNDHLPEGLEKAHTSKKTHADSSNTAEKLELRPLWSKETNKKCQESAK